MLGSLLAAAALALPAQAGVKVAFLGDQGLGPDARAVLELVRDERADLAVHSGDFDYDHDPKAWDEQITSVLGSTFPYVASLGNHDLRERRGYAAVLDARLQRTPEASCRGTRMVEETCVFRGVLVLLSGVRLTDSGGAAWLSRELAASSARWKICSWHYPHPEMQLGAKMENPGWEVYEACRKAGAIVATGHEHSYSRTYLLSDFPKKTIASRENVLDLRPGATFAFVSGLSGKSVRPQLRRGDWWASIYTKTQGATHGALFCEFDAPEAGRAYCAFKNVRREVIDSFELRLGAAPR